MLGIAVTGTGYRSTPAIKFARDLIFEACVLFFARMDLYATGHWQT